MFKHLFFFIVFSTLPTAAHAQEFKMRATLDSVPATGFYKILISPELTGYANADFSDIRIADTSGGFIPYIIASATLPLREQDSARNRDMTILSTVNEKNSSTIILASPTYKWTTGIKLTLNNTTVERYAKLSGSDDYKEWYIIGDYVLIKSVNANTIEQYSQDIRFPSNSYKYFKLSINNQHTDPIKIVAAAAIVSSPYVAKDIEEQPLPSVEFSQKDSSDHISYIRVKTDAKYLVNALSIAVTGANLYERNVTIDLIQRDKDTMTMAYSGVDFTLSSTKPAVVRLPAVKSNYMVLKIENGDNPPLKVTTVSILQDKQYLVSWLEKGRQYSLLTGKENALKPQYDLAKFTDSIPVKLPLLSYSKFSAIQANAVRPIVKDSHGYWIWIVIALAVTVLSYVTLRLLKDIKKEGAAN